MREAVARLARKELHKNGKPVPAANLHITLVFLGNVTEEQCQCLESMAGEIRAEPCTLTLDSFGFWPKPRILWLGPSRLSPELLSLVGSLNRGIQRCGFVPEKRAFRPHLTLARKASHALQRAPEPAIHWTVDRFTLVESVMSPEGSHYQVLRHWPLT